MSHPLLTQLRFTRAEFQRGLANVTESDARTHCGQMNCISWIIGHLAWQEQLYWLTRVQGQILLPELNTLCANGAPQSTPPLAEMWQAWTTVVQAANPYLESLTTETLTTHMLVDGKALRESVGTMLLRMIYHYWHHLGESQAIRQNLGHANLESFVGAIGREAPYAPQ
ncbi:MAG: DinB family protein [Chloroflexi bacterium]|nr:MAG: DinB family protein [Chloroflexota bacterium]